VIALLALGLAHADPPELSKEDITYRTGIFAIRPRAQTRPRFESRANNYWDNGSNDWFVTHRTNVGMDLEIAFTRATIEVRDVRNWGQFTNSTIQIPVGNTFIYQGYAEAFAKFGYIRVGRQAINYGNQRMIGALDWTSAGRAFDAVRAHGKWGIVTVDAVGAMVQKADQLVDTPGNTGGAYLSAAYVGVDPVDAFGLEAIWLSKHDLSVDTDRFSPGLRIKGKAGGFTYDAESYIQFGENFLAVIAMGDLAYNFGTPAGFSIRAGSAFGSGEAHGLNSVERFYGTDHKFQGMADLFYLSNLVEAHARFTFKPEGVPVTVWTEGLAFWRVSDADWVTVANGALPYIGNTDANYMGFEWDLTLGYSPTSWFSLIGNYSLFGPGAGASEGYGAQGLHHWGYVQLDFKLPG